MLWLLCCVTLGVLSVPSLAWGHTGSLLSLETSLWAELFQVPRHSLLCRMLPLASDMPCSGNSCGELVRHAFCPSKEDHPFSPFLSEAATQNEPASLPGVCHMGR